MLEHHSHQLLLEQFLTYYDQFSNPNHPMFEHNPSCGRNSHVGSPTSVTTHSPTLIHSQLYSPENSRVMDALPINDFQGVGQHINQYWSTLASENMSIMESMNRATPYSPEEKKERIERYRSKRNLRNFNKKIKYECRKTLADSRPRVRGRFARNDEIDKTSQTHEWDRPYVEEDDNIVHDYNWVTLLDAFATNFMP